MFLKVAGLIVVLLLLCSHRADSSSPKKVAPLDSPPDSPSSGKLGAHRPEPLRRALAAKSCPSPRSNFPSTSVGSRVATVSTASVGSSAPSSGALSLEPSSPIVRPECCSPCRSSARSIPDGWEPFGEPKEDGRASGAWGRPASPDLKLVWSVDEEAEAEDVETIDLGSAPGVRGVIPRRGEWGNSWANAAHDDRDGDEDGRRAAAAAVEDVGDDDEEEQDNEEDEDAYLNDPKRYVGYERWESDDSETLGAPIGGATHLSAAWDSNGSDEKRGSEPSFSFRCAGPVVHYAMPDAPSYANWESGSSGHLIATRGLPGRTAIARSHTEQNGLLERTKGGAQGYGKPFRTSSADDAESPRPGSLNVFDDSHDEMRHHSPLSEASTVFGRERFLTEDYEFFQNSPLSEASA